jgi:hypothetical protein
MRIEEGSLGGLVVYGTPEEWKRLEAGLEDLYSELKHDVLPVVENPTAGGVIINLKEALVIMAILQNEVESARGMRLPANTSSLPGLLQTVTST